MPRRIAQVVPYFAPHVGGVESHVESVSLELAKRGHDVHVVTTRLPGTEAETTWRGLPVHRVRQVANLFNTPVNRGLGKALDAVEPEILHSHSPPPVTSLHASRWVRGHRVPHVHTYHCDLDIPSPGGEMLVALYHRTLGRYTLRYVDHVVATTRSYAATSRALWRRGDVSVIPNPVDATRFHPGVDGAPIRAHWGFDDRPVAMFVGRLAPHKGVDAFIRSTAFTGAKVVHLVVGDGPERHRLERLAHRVPGGHKVRFAGRVTDEDLPAYYRAADLGVLPSTSRLEAFGIATLECMASGRPVVVSDIPGVTEVITEGTGLLAEPVNPRDLAAKIDALAGDPELRAAMGKRGRERVLERFTVETVVDRLEAVYHDLLE